MVCQEAFEDEPDNNNREFIVASRPEQTRVERTSLHEVSVFRSRCQFTRLMSGDSQRVPVLQSVVEDGLGSHVDMG